MIKKIIGFILVFMFIVAIPVFARGVRVISLGGVTTVAADSAVSAYRIDLANFGPEISAFGICATVTSQSGVTLKIEYMVSNDDITWVTAIGDPIKASWQPARTSGSTCYELDPYPSRYLTILFTEVGTHSGTSTLSATLAIR